MNESHPESDPHFGQFEHLEGPMSPEYSREEIVAGLNELDLAPSEKTELLLVYLGEKPATAWIYTAAMYREAGSEFNFGRERFDTVAAWAVVTGRAMEIVEETLNPMEWSLRGIEGKQIRAELAEKGRLSEAEAIVSATDHMDDRITLYFARDAPTLARMKEADQTRDPQLYGESVGFPATAIEAYIDRRCVSPRTVAAPVELETMAFAAYMVSPEHATEDLETAHHWAQAVKQADPELYAEMISAYQERTKAFEEKNELY